ncbi:hypothetical protein C8R47DRAFT_1062589 [Mycena vitilis]|nr:hypothetical protein C8R47DRAFT_1062589 [Mycena vitilis]
MLDDAKAAPLRRVHGTRAGVGGRREARRGQRWARGYAEQRAKRLASPLGNDRVPVSDGGRNGGTGQRAAGAGTGRPKARAAYRGGGAATVETAHVNGFNFPLPAPKTVPSVSRPASDSPYRKSYLFEAFRGTPATPSTPTRPPFRTALALAQLIGIKAATTPIAGGSVFGSGVASLGDNAMRTAPIGDKSTTPTPLFGGIPPPIVTASSPPASVTTPPFFSASPPFFSASPPIFRASSPPASVTTPPKHRRLKSVAAMSPTSSSSTAGGIMQPSTPLPAPLVTAAVLAAAIVTPPPVPVAAATSAPLPAVVSAPPPSASDAAGTHGTVSTPAVVLPGSRPATKPVKAPAKKAPAKAKAASGKGRKAPAKKLAMAEAGEKESAAGAAKKAADGGKKPRGRPRKVADTPAEVVAGASGSAAPLANTTNAEPGASSGAGRRSKGRPGDVADAAAKQAAKGWIDTTKNGGPTTIVLTRARKPNKYADGTLIPQIPNPHAKTEAALLARAAKGTSTASKRKAPQQAGKAAKKLICPSILGANDERADFKRILGAAQPVAPAARSCCSTS